ncbi:MAG: hypothetical protein QOI09_1984 [Chloroflexota bacterium]|nr:hypothetical protein [Chloroflexota bacterium]
MTLRSTILTFRIHRFETTLIVGATILSVVVSAAIVGWMSSNGLSRCLTDDTSALTGLCQGTVNGWVLRIGHMSINIVPIFPYVAGLLIGVPLVARELEGGTARLAWSLGPSRIRWFVQRALPALVMVGLAALLIGLTSDALYRAFQPGHDLDQSFLGFRQRGLLVGVEAVLVASVALALGSILGRFVPTFVLSLILAAGIGVAIDKVEGQLLTSEALVSTNYDWNGTDYFLDSRFLLKDGSVVTWQELSVLRPEIENQGVSEDIGAPVTLYIPGSRYHEIEMREALVLGGVAGLFAVVAAIAVVRRRPR